MPTRYATVNWSGGLKDGKGALTLESGVLKDTAYDYKSRFETGPLTNPEELLGAAHAGCFTMFLSSLLEKNNTLATNLETKADVTLTPGEGGPTITKIVLHLTGTVPNITKEKFEELAKEAKAKCPISKSLASVPSVELNISLK